MKVQMLHSMVYRVPGTKLNEVYHPGDVVDLTDAEAAQLIAEGSAVAADRPAETAPASEAKPKRPKVV